MSTKLYLRDTQKRVAGYYDLDIVAGSGSATAVVNTAASGTDIQWTKTAGGSAMKWISGPLASGFTLTTTDISINAMESDAKANCGGRYRVFKYSGGSETELGGGPFDDGVEFSKPDGAVMTWAGNVTDTAFAAGDRIVLKLFITNVGTMAAGYICTLTYDTAVGNSFLNLNENVTFASDSPSVTLNTPAPGAEISDPAPTFDFTGIDPGGDKISYNIEIDTIDSFNSRGNAGVNTYLFDAHLNTVPGYPDDPNSQWSDEQNAADGSILTYASCVTGGNTEDSGYLEGKGINIVSGASISLVRFRYYYTSSVSIVRVSVWTKGHTEKLGQKDELISTPPKWSTYRDLTVPTGGWTWQKIANLEFRAWQYTEGVFNLYRVELEVTAGSDPLLAKRSVEDAGFVNPDNEEDLDPFTSGENIQYTVQEGEELEANTYYWRVRGIDPSGTNIYGDWSATRSFTITGVEEKTQTVTAKGNIKVTTNQTVQSKSRIETSLTQTITAKGNIQPGVIQTTQTITAKGDIKKTTTQAQISAASIIVYGVTRTTTAKGRIQKSSSQILTALGRIQIFVSKTLTSKGRITQIESYTIQAKGSIKQALQQVIESKARVQIPSEQIIQALARITQQFSQLIEAKGRIKIISTQTITALGRTSKAFTQNIEAKSRITASRIQTAFAKGCLKLLAVARTIESKGRITITTSQQITTLARILRSQTTTISALGRVEKLFAQLIQSKASIKQSQQQIITAIASIKITSEKTIEAKANIIPYLIVKTQTIESKASFKKIITQSIEVQANIKQEYTQVLEAKGLITTTTERALEAKARIQKSQEQIIEAKARISSVFIQTIEAKARVQEQFNQSINALGRISTIQTSIIEAKSRIKIISTQDISALARVQKRFIQIIQAQADIQTSQGQVIEAKAYIVVVEEKQQTISVKGNIKQVISQEVNVKGYIVPGFQTKTQTIEAKAEAHMFVELFDSETYKDPATTADWNVGLERVYLPQA